MADGKMADGKERPTYRTRRAAAQETKKASQDDTMQSLQSTMALKRKRDEELGSIDLTMADSNADGTEVASSTEATQSPTAIGGLARAEFAAASVLASCQAALVNSPAAARSVLLKHQTHIYPSLAQVLGIVGGYKVEDGCTPLHTSAKLGDSKTVECLLAAGADVGSKDANGATPFDLATDDGCRKVLEHHSSILVDVVSDPDGLVTAAIAHCASLSASDWPRPVRALSLQDYHLDPFLHWVPPPAGNILITKALDVYTAQIAANTQPFLELPDDCAGEVLGYLKTTLMRTELLEIAEHCSSPEACAWMHAVVVAAVVNGATAELKCAYLKSKLEASRSRAMRKCLEEGADVDMRCTDGRTLLMRAASEDDVAVLELFLHAGADTEAKDERGYTALILASLKGHTTSLKLLLEAGADTEATSNEDGSTALIKAPIAGCTNMVRAVELLLNAGADKDAINHIGSSALMNASIKGHVAVVKLLLKAGANTEIVNSVNTTALFSASENGHAEIVKLLLMAGAQTDITDHENGTALTVASLKNYIAIVEFLLVAGANKEAKNAIGDTALISAARNGYTPMVELLLQVGADKETKNRDDDSALALAVEKGHTDTVQVLLRANADKELKSNQDESMALSLASFQGHTAIVDLLLQTGADKDFENNEGETPLIGASIAGHAAIVELLLLAGADTDIVNDEGKTALILAVEYGHADIVKCLLMAGADTEIKDFEYDSTALMWASCTSDANAAIVKNLLLSGADIDAKEKEGQTALGCAQETGSPAEVVALLQKWRPRPCV